MNGQLGLGFVFTVRDMASGRMRQLEGTFRSLDERVGLGAARIERAFQRMGLALGVFSAGAATVAAGLALTGVAARFETAVAQVAAVSGATATELELLRDAALEAGIATQFSPTEAAMGLRELTQVGYSARDSMQLLIPVLDLAAASMGQLSPQQAAGLAAQTLHAFGLEVDDAARSVDQLMQAANLFALDSQELAMALGIASRGAQSMHQSLGETLSALGLVKNVIPGIERASTAVAVSMERMTAPRTQRALRSVGVEVVDSAGRFRQFLDVVQELGPALEHMTDAQRSAFLLETFGHHAMGGLSALMTALREGVPTAEGAIPGAEGVRHLREQFEHADGAAAHFREQMLGTFEGQQRLLMGSLETLGILAGQPFLELFRPVVGAIVDAVNGVIAVFRALPAPVLRSLAGLTTVLGGFVSLVGAALAGQASIAILTLALEAAGVTLAGLAVTFAAPTAAAAALGLAFVAVRTAFDRNVGGIADAAVGVAERVQLAFSALGQLFESGELSGQVRDELARADRSGVRQFVVSLYMLGHRALAVFAGVRDGFAAAIDSAGPALTELQSLFSTLSKELGELMAVMTGSANALPSSEYRSFGASVGAAVGGVLRDLVDATNAVLRFTTAFVGGLRTMADFFQPAVKAIREGTTAIGLELDRLTGGRMGASAASFDLLSLAGRALGVSLAQAATAIAAGILLVLSAVRGALSLVREAQDRWSQFTSLVVGVGRVVRAQLAPVTETVTRVVRVAIGAMTALLDAAAAHVRAIAGVIDAAITGVQAQLRSVLALVPRELLPEGLREAVTGSEPGEGSRRAVVPVDVDRSPVVEERNASRLPAAAAAVREGAANQTVVALLRTLVNQSSRSGTQGNRREVITLQVDGETLARVARNAEAQAAARSFTPVPVY